MACGQIYYGDNSTWGDSYWYSGKTDKMILSWFLALPTIGIYPIYNLYTLNIDQKEFNDRMDYAIMKRRKQLKENT